MKCLNKKVRLRKEQMDEERRKAEEEKYLNSLSDEEHAEYLKSQEERGRCAMRLLTTAMAMTISAGAFSAKYGEGGESNG